MIEVKGLTKVYKSIKKDKCIALNNVSFTLDDSGFVFIIGKSGSGKTTLLSILGGLEEMTEGVIDVDGIAINNYNEKHLVEYRNATVGYIFQDYHLIDELTIKENIGVSLSLQGEKDDDKIMRALADVGLSGYENRYPKEMSGGEKQRVAIARALVKDPTIILADEPTGNLDSKITEQILSLLKRLSKDRLVLIVSHNLNDAAEYADRIIELSQGEIINDYIRNPEYNETASIEKGKLFIPLRKRLSDDEKTQINTSLQKGEIKELIQTDDTFIPTPLGMFDGKEKKVTAVNRKKNHISIKNTLGLSFTFIKKDLIMLFFYAFIVACLIIVLGLSELIVTFDASEVIEKELNVSDHTSVSFSKDTIDDLNIDQNCILDISDDEIDSFVKNGYSGNIYKLIHMIFEYGEGCSVSHNQRPSKFNPTDAFYKGTRGVLITTEEYIESIFGEIKYIAVADKIEKGGVYITDYSADAMIYYNPILFPNYQATLGNNKSSGNNTYGYVNGIIDTGYKDKYNDLLEQFRNVNISKDELLEMTDSDEYRSYYDDIIQNLSIAYTTNPDFINDTIELNAKSWLATGSSIIIKDGKECPISTGFIENAHTRTTLNLKEDEIVMGIEIYNQTFGTNYSKYTMSEFEPHDITFNYSYYYDLDTAKPKASLNVKVVGLTNENVIYFPDNLFKQVLKCELFTSAVYFDDISNMETLLSTSSELNFSADSIIAYSLSTMTKAVSVFTDFFGIIFIGLCICTFFIIANYGIKLVKERKYEMGILKALGIRELDLVIILGVQLLLFLALAIVIYILGSIIFIDLANDILIRSLLELAPGRFMMNIKILYIDPSHFLTNSILTIIISTISFIIPLIKLRKLKPTQIIKAKE